MSPQVRNLCYMVTRRERTKHTICKLQEQIFHLQMKLMEQDLCRGRHGTFPAGKVCLWGLEGPGSLLTTIALIRSMWEPVNALEPEFGLWLSSLPSVAPLVPWDRPVA